MQQPNVNITMPNLQLAVNMPKSIAAKRKLNQNQQKKKKKERAQTIKAPILQFRSILPRSISPPILATPMTPKITEGHNFTHFLGSPAIPTPFTTYQANLPNTSEAPQDVDRYLVFKE